jgi:glycosyltransferase involved in cell wall biosynthesis
MHNSNPFVSIIVPSKNRAWLHAGLLSVFRHQDYSNIEMLVADSGDNGQSESLVNVKDDNIHYYWLDNDISVGSKRNFLIEQAKGEVIVHFDDDDYYAPNYVSKMVQLMQDYDFVTLSAWYNLDVRTGDLYYWDTVARSDYVFTPGLTTTVSTNVVNTIGAHAANTWGYGFCYAYKRRLWEQHRFPDINLEEDIRFVQAFKDKVPTLCFEDMSCLVVHSLWEHTLSSCSPQYRLPRFLLEQISKDASCYYKTFHKASLIDEFIYFSRLDSDGGDLEHVGKMSVNALLDRCLSLGGVAVNTNGWVKKTLKPQEQWSRLPLNSGGMWVHKEAIEE